MAHQTVHGRPIAFARLARVPESVEARSEQLRRLAKREEWRRLLEEFQIRWVVRTVGGAPQVIDTSTGLVAFPASPAP
jgi:hypothetical protein